MLNCLKPSGMLKSGLSSNLTLHSPDFLEIGLGKALAANYAGDNGFVAVVYDYG